jgi:hypothetical protein
MRHTEQQVRDFVENHVKHTYEVERFEIVYCEATPDPESGNYPPEWEVGIQWTHDQGVCEDCTLSIQEPPTDGKPWLTVTSIDGTEPPSAEQNSKAMELLLLSEEGEWETPSWARDSDDDEWRSYGWRARTYSGEVAYRHPEKATVEQWLLEQGYHDSGDGIHYEREERKHPMSDEIQVRPGVAGSYNVSSLYSKETIGFNAQGLLDLAEWIEQHREELSTEGKQAMSEDEVNKTVHALLEELPKSYPPFIFSRNANGYWLEIERTIIFRGASGEDAIKHTTHYVQARKNNPSLPIGVIYGIYD